MRTPDSPNTLLIAVLESVEAGRAVRDICREAGINGPELFPLTLAQWTESLVFLSVQNTKRRQENQRTVADGIQQRVPS